MDDKQSVRKMLCYTCPSARTTGWGAVRDEEAVLIPRWVKNFGCNSVSICTTQNCYKKAGDGVEKVSLQRWIGLLAKLYRDACDRFARAVLERVFPGSCLRQVCVKGGFPWRNDTQSRTQPATRKLEARNLPSSSVLQFSLSNASVACTEDAHEESRTAAAATAVRINRMLMRVKLV